MSPQLITLILQALITYGPVVTKEIVNLFKKQNPTLEDWDKIFDMAAKSYDDYVKPKDQ